MLKYILKRFCYMLIIFIMLSIIMFVLYDMIPFDRAQVLQAKQKEQYKNDPAGYEQLYYDIQKELGLDKGLAERYLIWLGVVPLNGEYQGILQGDFGVSYENLEKPVLDVIKAPMSNTIFINIFATILGLGVTIPLGIFCAVKRGSKRDVAVQVGSIVGYSMPVFITAILFIFLFAIKLGWFPVSGTQTPGTNYAGVQLLLDKLYYLGLPLIVMTFCSLGGMTRYVRASMIEALSMDCIKTARAKGVKERFVIYSHAWRNALIPIVTLVIGWFLTIFSGSIMIENIFGINGLGKLYINSLSSNDFDVVITLQMFYVGLSLLGNLIIDIAYGFIDPRIRVSK